jgi:hypothetical protein
MKSTGGPAPQLAMLPPFCDAVTVWSVLAKTIKYFGPFTMEKFGPTTIQNIKNIGQQHTDRSKSTDPHIAQEISATINALLI